MFEAGASGSLEWRMFGPIQSITSDRTNVRHPAMVIYCLL